MSDLDPIPIQRHLEGVGRMTLARHSAPHSHLDNINDREFLRRDGESHAQIRYQKSLQPAPNPYGRAAAYSADAYSPTTSYDYGTIFEPQAHTRLSISEIIAHRIIAVDRVISRSWSLSSRR